jgi:hypothetical protein
MSVDQRRIVDAVGTSRQDGHIVLTIADHLPFDGDASRLLTLQEKINDYLDFIESGELCQSYPAAVGQTIEISIRFLHSPDDLGRSFLATAERFIRAAGLTLSFTSPQTTANAEQNGGGNSAALRASP